MKRLPSHFPIAIILILPFIKSSLFPRLERCLLNLYLSLLHIFQVGHRLSLDRAFVDFLIYVQVQPDKIHSYTICTIMALVVFCHTLDCELCINTLRIFFSSLCMTDNNFSLRSRKNKVQFFYLTPNIVDFKSRQVMVESKIRFPFLPCVTKRISRVR